ncbi:hypothetical protein TanjilG_16511 [Lupinus angustifolius]|uniref:Uncharacterized protein n=1 Tax=Lupinus angustifolius TaxID=3871 RepID=A0A1J7ILW9_LUPAN|nr:hypothetical protein TanjilG_16511 [Lupinus angustifolius]
MSPGLSQKKVGVLKPGNVWTTSRHVGDADGSHLRMIVTHLTTWLGYTIPGLRLTVELRWLFSSTRYSASNAAYSAPDSAPWLADGFSPDGKTWTLFKLSLQAQPHCGGILL